MQFHIDSDYRDMFEKKPFHFVDRYGWPVTRTSGKFILNVLSALFQTDVIKTIKQQLASPPMSHSRMSQEWADSAAAELTAQIDEDIINDVINGALQDE